MDIRKSFLKYFVSSILILTLAFIFANNVYSSFVTVKYGFPTIHDYINLKCNPYKNNIKCVITVENSNYTFPDAYLTIDVVKEGKTGYRYPSQYSDDNIIYEKSVKLELAPNSITSYKFIWGYPQNISSGRYRIDVYLHTHYIPLSGIPFIFASPISYEFYINNSTGKYPYFKILRNCTNLNEHIVGPIGGFVNTSGRLKINLCVLSKINSSAYVKIYITPWNDICFSSIYSKTFSIMLNKGINRVPLSLSLNALKPNAYSVKLDIYDLHHIPNSIYRLRFIVPGPTAKVRGIFTDFPWLTNLTRIFIIVGPSPDHYTFPTINNVSVELMIRRGNNILFNKNIITIPQLSTAEQTAYTLTYIPASLNKILKSYTLCVYLKKNNKVLDYLCKYFNFENYTPSVQNILIFNKNNNIVVELVNHGIIVPCRFTLILSYNSPKNVLFSGIYNGHTEIPIKYNGKYYITVYSGNLTKTKVITINNLNTPLILNNSSSSIYKNTYKEQKNTNFFLAFIITCFIILGIIIILMKIKGRSKRYMVSLLFLFLFGLFSHSIEAYPYAVISTNKLCVPYGKIVLYTHSDSYPYNVSAFLNTNNILHSHCSSQDCTYVLNINHRSPTTLNLLIEFSNNSSTFYTTSFNINVVYPFSFSLSGNSVERGASFAVLLTKQCNYINNVPISIYAGSILLRNNCVYPGDPEWQDMGNACGVSTSSLSPSTYNITVKYTVDGITITQNIGTLTVNPSSPGFISGPTYCEHGWGTSNIVTYNIGFSGEHKLIGSNEYAISPSSNVIIKGISMYNFVCSNGANSNHYPIVGAWVYYYNTFKKYFENSPYSDITEDYFTFKNYIETRGYTKPNQNVYGSYNKITINSFSIPGHYTIYLAEMKAFCNNPRIFICPSERGYSNPCYIGHLTADTRYVGFVELGSLGILVPEPKIDGIIYNYSSYTFENKIIKTFYIGYVQNIGIGDVYVNMTPYVVYANGTIKNLKKISLLLSEGDSANLYYKVPWYLCLHQNCTIYIPIYYDDGYGFHSILPKLYNVSYINITWNKLNYTIPKVIIHDSKQFVIPINVTNLGPVIAKDINVHDLKYNSHCLSLWTGSSINLYPGENGKIFIFGRINSLNCKARDYVFTFNIYGWNTYIYPHILEVPVSKIEFPPSGIVLTNLVTFKIWDANANRCFIYIEGNKYSRSCNSSFVYNNYCSKTGICIINVSSTNSNFTFYSKQYIYSIPNLASKGIVSSYTPNTLYLKQGSSAKVYITLRNTKNNPIKCSMGVDTNLLEIKSITQDNQPILSIPYQFNIPPSTTLYFLINFQAIKLGMENTKIHFSCSENRRIDIIIPTVVYNNQQLTGSVKEESVDEKISYLLLLGMSGILLLI